MTISCVHIGVEMKNDRAIVPLKGIMLLLLSSHGPIKITGGPALANQVTRVRLSANSANQMSRGDINCESKPQECNLNRAGKHLGKTGFFIDKE